MLIQIQDILIHMKIFVSDWHFNSRKLLQNFNCLPDWPFPIGKCNSFPKEKSFWKIFIPPLRQYRNPNMFKIPVPAWKWGERMCVGDSKWIQKTHCSPGKVMPALTCSGHAAVEEAQCTKDSPALGRWEMEKGWVFFFFKWGDSKQLSPFYSLSLHVW